MTFDWRGHGNSMNLQADLDVATLIQDVERVMEYVITEFQYSNIILVGHSMGGSLAVKSLNHVLHSGQKQVVSRIMGIIVIDVVEGTAMEALPYME